MWLWIKVSQLMFRNKSKIWTIKGEAGKCVRFLFSSGTIFWIGEGFFWGGLPCEAPVGCSPPLGTSIHSPSGGLSARRRWRRLVHSQEHCMGIPATLVCLCTFKWVKNIEASVYGRTDFGPGPIKCFRAPLPQNLGKQWPPKAQRRLGISEF